MPFLKPDQTDRARSGDDRRFVRPFLFMMGVYLCMVHLWTLFQYPLGRDYAAMAAPAALPGFAGTVFAWETHCFGAFVPGYHLANLVLLYLCMCAIFFLTRALTQGPWWLGSLAAVLTMAHPLKSEATLNLCGVVDMLPAFLALAALLGYALHLRRPRAWKYFLSLAFFVAAVFSSPVCLGLIGAIAALEYFLAPYDRRPARLAIFAFLAVWGLGVHHAAVTAAALAPGPAFAPLAYIVYPIGVLPETAARYHEHPALGWLAAMAGILCVIAVGRSVNRPAFWCALAGAVAMRLFQGGVPVEPVHLAGGGSMVVSIALGAIAFAALCGRVAEHPKWHKPVVLLTTLMCVLFFLLHARENLAWRYAARQVRAFQTAALRAAEEHPGETLAAAPDLQYFLGAPMKLSESVRHVTPFSPGLPVEGVLPLNYGVGMTWECIEWGADRAMVAVHGATVNEEVPAPYPGNMRYGVLARPAVLSHWAWDGNDTTWLLVPRGRKLPLCRIEYNAAE